MAAAHAAPPAPSSPMAEATVQQALEWQVTFWSGETTARERAAFDRWLAQDPAHAQAWQAVQCTDSRIQSATGPLAGAALRAADASRRATGRRRLLGAAGLLAGAGVAAYAVRGSPPLQSLLAEHRTGRGERRALLLPDGTRLTLNTDSAVDLRFTALARDVHLRAGEIFVATAPDPQAAAGQASRPFTVHTRHGAVRAIGTRFTVRQSDGRSRAAVEQGAVQIQPGLAGAAPVRLATGQQAWFSEAAVETPVAADAGHAAWTRGLLVAERMRLQDLLAELGRYRSGVLRCDPAVADLVVSGVYRLDDTDLALSTLAQALPVRTGSVTRYWVTVRAQDR